MSRRRPLHRSAKKRATRRLQLESLEVRSLLAVFSPLPGTDDGAAGSLRSAMVESQSNQEDDTIELGEGIYTLQLGDLLVDEPNTSLRIVGAGSGQTVIKIEGDTRAFDVDFEARLEVTGVAIFSGNADEGGQIRSAGTVVLSDVILQSGTAVQGGAIFNGGDLTLTDVQFVGNVAGVGGGIWNHAGATLTATNTRWLRNFTSERLGALIESPGQVGIVFPGSENRASPYSIPPRGATALFNAGIAHLDSVDISGNVSDTGAAIHNIGDAAQLRIEDSLIYDNQSVPREETAPSVLLSMRGTVEILDTAIFNNSARYGFGGTFYVLGGSIDMNHVSVFNNPSPSYGFITSQSSVRMEHVTYVRSGPRGIKMGGAAHTVFEVTASAIDRFRAEVNPDQFHSGGGNWIGIGASQFDHPTDRQLPLDKQEDLFWFGTSFDFLPPGVYEGQVALPPTATSELIDALDSGLDAGAFEHVAGMQQQGPLPTAAISGDLSILEDGPPLLIDSLIANAIDAVAAHGTITRNDQGRLVYQTEANFEGHDRLMVQQPDGEMRSWIVVVTPQADPPTIEDFTVTLLGRSEVLGRNKPTDTEVTDLNAVTASHVRDAFYPPDGNPSPGPDVGGEIDQMGLVVDGELVEGGPQWTHDSEVPYWLSGDVARPWLKIDYIPEPDFSGLDAHTVRIINTSGLSADATVTFNVLDPNTTPKIGRVTATIIDQSFRPVDSVGIGDIFYVEYRIDDLRDDNHPLQTLQRDFHYIKGIFNVGGTPLENARACTDVCKPNPFGDGKVAIQPQPIGNFNSSRTPPTQLDPSNLRYDVELSALSGQSGSFYRVAIQATAAGTITADIPYLIASGVGMQGTVPYDWFEIVTDSVEVRATNTNTNLREDVNQDGVVAPLDALIVINSLNAVSGESETVGQATSTPANYKLDVNGDGHLTPNDVLIVVNYLNRNPVVAGQSGEGESVEAESVPLEYALADAAISNEYGLQSTLVDEVLSTGEDVPADDGPVAPLQTLASRSQDDRESFVMSLEESDDEEDKLNCLDKAVEELSIERFQLAD